MIEIVFLFHVHFTRSCSIADCFFLEKLGIDKLLRLVDKTEHLRLDYPIHLVFQRIT